MAFSSISDIVLLQILRHLPFEDHVSGAGVVNTAFRRMAQIAISETKSLNLDNAVFKKMTPSFLSTVLNLCANDLEEITFPSSFYSDSEDLLRAFADYACPKLTKLASPYIDNGSLKSILNNSPDLRVLDCIEVDLSDVVIERLETLHCNCTLETYDSLAGRVPNLKHFEAYADIEPRLMDNFLGTVPNLETLEIRTSWQSGLNFESESLSNFWKLKSLESLIVEDDDPEHSRSEIRDHTLMRISKAFPRLRVLKLLCTMISNSGVAALSSLKDLRKVTLECTFQERIDGGVHELANCEHLEKLSVAGTTYLSRRTLTALFHSCPRLSSVDFFAIGGVGVPQQAVAFIESLHGIEKRDITLTFDTERRSTHELWHSQEVKEAVENLEKVDGVAIKFRWPSFP